MTTIQHQKKICNLIVDYIEKRYQQKLIIVGIPDEIEKNVPAVDLWFKDINDHEYVMEHTIIESFPRQIGGKKGFEQLFIPLEAELYGKLPSSADFTLEVYINDIVDNKDDYNMYRNNLITWVTRKATELVNKNQNDKSVSEEPGFLPYSVTLIKHPDGDGHLHVLGKLPSDFEEQRKTRIQKALDDKCPKLAEAKEGFRQSFLLLELIDDPYSTYRDIIGILRELLPAKEATIPDNIYLVDSEDLYILKEGTNMLPEVSDYGPHKIE